MAIQKLRGTAFEFACLDAFYCQLKNSQSIVVVSSNAVGKAKKAYHDIDDDLKAKMNKAAMAAAKQIIKIEPQLAYTNNNEPLYLDIQEDAKGQQGDVRDVLCIRKQNGWEIGLSCKHNHTAVKHSRLSKLIDFGDKWFGIPCSQKYFDTIIPIFSELEKLRKDKALWREIEDKEARFYIPVLVAFMDELKRLDYESSENIPTRLLTYLIGKNDFYKVISKDSKKTTQIQAYNLFGTLNNPSGNNKPKIRVPIMKLPTKFFDINYKENSTNTMEVVCNNGWTVSMRIHNASSKVEPSLKFDITLIGVPPDLYSHYAEWE